MGVARLIMAGVTVAGLGVDRLTMAGGLGVAGVTVAGLGVARLTIARATVAGLGIARLIMARVTVAEIGVARLTMAGLAMSTLRAMGRSALAGLALGGLDILGVLDWVALGFFRLSGIPRPCVGLSGLSGLVV